MPDHPVIEVCMAPPLLPFMPFLDGSIIVVTDVLRASTSICTALDYGAATVIPVSTVEEALHYKNQGFFVAGERDGVKLDFADAGNSPFEMMRADLARQTIVFTTTNGTQAMKMAFEKSTTVIGTFTNIESLGRWLVKQQKDVLIFCAGWKNRFSLEDTLFAGALIEWLLSHGKHTISSDETHAALDLWHLASSGPLAYILKASHPQRLKEIGQDDALSYCFQYGISDSVPMVVDGKIVNLNPSSQT